MKGECLPMKTMHLISLLLIVGALSIVGLATPAAAGSGTLKGTFVYTDPVTKVEQGLYNGFIYLHNASKPPPMEKFQSKADYILGITLSSGTFSVSVPEGSYYVRILRRKTTAPGASMSQYGPPVEGDYTWMQHRPITVTASKTLDLGKVQAVLYTASPVTITGTVKSAGGVPLEGRYVRAQTEPCLAPVNCTDSGCEQYGNQCGEVKFLALQTTDAAGKYTLFLPDPGTYYIYSSPCLMPGHNLSDSLRCEYSAAPAPVTVKRGDKVSVDIVVP